MTWIMSLFSGKLISTPVSKLIFFSLLTTEVYDRHVFVANEWFAVLISFSPYNPSAVGDRHCLVNPPTLLYLVPEILLGVFLPWEVLVPC